VVTLRHSRFCFCPGANCSDRVSESEYVVKRHQKFFHRGLRISAGNDTGVHIFEFSSKSKEHRQADQIVNTSQSIHNKRQLRETRLGIERIA
jgi:hypothetical protein